jgi:hypothetical protein
MQASMLPAKNGAFHGKTVTNQFYMKNYVQESLRFLREKAKEHENEIRNQTDTNANMIELQNQDKNNSFELKKKVFNFKVSLEILFA